MKWFKKKTKRKKEEEYECEKKKIVKCFKWILHKLRIQFCTLNESLQYRELFTEKWMTLDRKRKKKNWSKSYLCVTPYWHWKKKVSWFFNAITASRCADGILCSNNFHKYLAFYANYVAIQVWCSCKIVDANSVVEADNLKKRMTCSILNCFFPPFFPLFFIFFIFFIFLIEK